MARDTQIEVQAPPTLDALLGARDDQFGQLVGAAAMLIQDAARLRAADNAIARAFIRDQVEPWQLAATSKHDSLRLLLISHVSELRAAAELAQRGEAATAIQLHGDLLKSVGKLAADVKKLRSARPFGPALTSLQLLAHLPSQHVSNEVREILEIVLPPTAHSIAEERIADIASRLVLDGVAAEVWAEITRQIALVRFLEQEPVTA